MSKFINALKILVAAVLILALVVFLYQWIDDGEMTESEKAAYIDGYHAGVQAYNDALQNKDGLHDEMYSMAQDVVGNVLNDYPGSAMDLIPELVIDGMDQYVDNYLKYASEEAEYECLENE